MHTAIFLPEKHCNIDLFFLPSSPSSVLREAAAQETGAVAPLLCAAFMAQPSRLPLFGDRFSMAEIWACLCVTIYLFIPGVSSQLFSLCFSLENLWFCCISGFSQASLVPFYLHIRSLVKEKYLKTKLNFCSTYLFGRPHLVAREGTPQLWHCTISSLMS